MSEHCVCACMLASMRMCVQMVKLMGFRDSANNRACLMQKNNLSSESLLAGSTFNAMNSVMLITAERVLQNRP